MPDLTPEEYAALIDATEKAAGLPPGLMRGHWMQESTGRTRVKANRSGARSPFQIMPGTARAFGYKGPLEHLDTKPEVAIKLAADIMRYHWDKYQNVDDTIASYYQGNNKKDKTGKSYRAKARPGHPSADEYVASVRQHMVNQMPQPMSSVLNPQPPQPQFQAAMPQTTATPQAALLRRQRSPGL